MSRHPITAQSIAKFVPILLLFLLAGCTSMDAFASVGTRLPPTTTPAAPAPTPTAAIKGDAARGKALFNKGVGDAPSCSSCHALAAGPFAIGPALGGISKQAGTRVAGMDAEAYLRQSILDPKAYTVSGFRPIMYADYATHLSAQDIADLIAYLSTL